MSNIYSIILAPNPSFLTGPGTSTIVLGGGSAGACVIDPADDNPDHLAAIIAEGERRGGIRRILITHGHPDHVGGASELSTQLGVPIAAFSRRGVPCADEEIIDNATFSLGEDTLRALYTPGHRFDHLCFLLERQRTLFAGDLLASSSTVVIPSPPEGDMLDYINSLKRLQQLQISEIVPAHGLIITNPQEKIADYIAHRLEREQQIIDILRTKHSPVSIQTLVETIYASTDSRLYPLATQSVNAHLLKLEREGRARCCRNALDTEQDEWELT